MREYVAATAGVLLPLGDDLPDGVLALWRDKGAPLDGDGLRVVQLSRHELAVAFRGAQLRETLERERQELTAIVDGATDAIIQVDEECSIVRVQSAPEAAPHTRTSSATTLLARSAGGPPHASSWLSWY